MTLDWLRRMSKDEYDRLTMVPKDEGLNPRVTCGFSKDADELDTHAPVDLYKPEDMPKKDVDFTSAF